MLGKIQNHSLCYTISISLFSHHSNAFRQRIGLAPYSPLRIRRSRDTSTLRSIATVTITAVFATIKKARQARSVTLATSSLSDEYVCTPELQEECEARRKLTDLSNFLLPLLGTATLFQTPTSTSTSPPAIEKKPVWLV